MPLTLTFTFTAPCDGGEHFTATGTLTPGPSRTLPVQKKDVKVPVTVEEADVFLSVLLRLYVNQLAGSATAAEIAAAIEAKTLDLTVS